MPWSNQSGGGNGGGGGGGPWGQKGGGSGGGGGPWGAGPGSGGGKRPPDLEEILRRSQDRIRNIIPGGGGTGGPMGARGIAFVVLAAALLWLATGIYTVKPDEVGINLIFGRYVGQTKEGLNYNFPYPIGSVEKPKVTTRRTVEIGMRASDPPRRANVRGPADESMMLTGDENIVDIDFSVQWQVDPAKVRDYVFNLANPDGTIRVVAESAMREVVGRRNIQTILTVDRAAIEAEVKQSMQETLNHYGAGADVILVQLLKVDPPIQVIDAFRDVQAARQDQDRVRNEAETYASKVVPEARGESTRIVQGAEAYRERIIAEAQGAASRFTQVYEEYRKAPDVTRERMFLETMERVLGGSDKIILDQNGPGVVPYLPLNEIRRPQAGTPSQGAQR